MQPRQDLPQQERLPLMEFRNYDDRVWILWAGLAKVSTMGMNPMDIAAATPETTMPRICKYIADEAPDDPILSNPQTVQKIFNVLAYANRLGSIPPLET